MRYPIATRERAREMRTAGEKMDYIAAALGAPLGTIREWTKDMPSRCAPRPRWCPPHLRTYERNLGWYWRIPLPLRKKIIAAIAARPMTKRDRCRMARAMMRGGTQ